MNVEEMRTLVEMLTRRMEDVTNRKDKRVQKMLSDPTDRNISVQLHLIHEDEKILDNIWDVIKEIRFDIEDITGEPEA